MHLAIRIKTLRTELGLTQIELADKVRVSKATVINWEQGKRMPDAVKLGLLADALKTSTDYLTERTDDPRPLTHLQDEARDSQSKEGDLNGSKSREEESTDQTEGAENFPHAEGFMVPPSRPDTDKRLFRVSNHKKTVEVEFYINDPPDFISLLCDKASHIVDGDDSAKTSSGAVFKSVVGGDTSS